MDLARLQELKQKLLYEEKLTVVWSFFTDHFADHDEFVALGEHTRHPFVEAVLAQLGQQLFADKGTVRNLILTRVPEQHFLHGGFGMAGRVGGVIYFEDVGVGLLAVSPLPPSIDVNYARFSGQPIKRYTNPSRN
jgi:hypothetical protein